MDQSTPHAAPVEVESETQFLLNFVRNRDVACPRCEYNLRDLTTPVCPECREALSLKIGVRSIRLHWLILSLAPGGFCAIALTIFVVMCMIHGAPGPMPVEGYLTLGFMMLSSCLGAAIALRSHRFLAQTLEAQTLWAIGIWVPHVLIFIWIVANT